MFVKEAEIRAVLEVGGGVSAHAGGGLVVVCMTSFTSMIGVTSYVRLLNCYKRLRQPGFLGLGRNAVMGSPGAPNPESTRESAGASASSSGEAWIHLQKEKKCEISPSKMSSLSPSNQFDRNQRSRGNLPQFSPLRTNNGARIRFLLGISSALVSRAAQRQMLNQSVGDERKKAVIPLRRAHARALRRVVLSPLVSWSV